MSWEQLVKIRRELWVLSWILYGIAVVAAVSEFFVEGLLTEATILALLGSHTTTAAVALGKIANLQAALDMKRLHMRSEPLAVQTYALFSGDEAQITARDGTRFNLIPDRMVNLRVEFLG